MVRPAAQSRPAPARTIFVTTAGGAPWRLLDPCAMDVDWRVIAAHLAKLCRFGGAASSHYSVAQHSIVVAEQLPPHLRLYGLLHDAHEAVIGDITSPVAAALAALAGRTALLALKDLQDVAIHQAAGLPWPPPEESARLIHEADMRALATEWRDLMPAGVPCPVPARPLSARIKPWSWSLAEERFRAALDTHLPAHLRRPA